MEFPTTRVFNYSVFSGDIETIQLINRPLVINTINAYSYVVAKTDSIFHQALKESDILLPDGFPIVVAAKWLTGKKIKKIAGADIFYHLCSYLNSIAGRCFFLGSTNEILTKIEQNLSEEFPNIEADYYSPPYKSEFAFEDNQRMLSKINTYKPDVVFVGMTAPKQEKWVFGNYQAINAGIICSIGAVFDFYAGSITRPSAFWINLRLEWFIRLIKEPKRLWKRYLIYSPILYIDLFLFKLRIKRI